MRIPNISIMWGAGCVGAALIAWSGVSADTIQGSVRDSGGDHGRSDDADRDFYWKVWNGALPEQPEVYDYSDTLAVLTGKFTGPPIGCDFAFLGGGLEPSTLAARSGTTMRVQNRDGFTHELTVDGLPGFTPLESGPDTVRTIAVPAGGPWRVGDRMYGHVDGHLHSMRELVACTSVSADGQFRFENVPPGPYSLRILRGPDQVATQRVVISPGKPLQVGPLTLKNGGRD